MDKLRCQKNDCQQSATKFCFNCKAMLCKSHRASDIKEQLIGGRPEHYHIDASEYYVNCDSYQCYFCIIHQQEMLTGRCINCGKVSCNACPPEMCPKTAGSHHDYDGLSDWVTRYKDELFELEQLLQIKHEIFQRQLKEACRALENTDFELQKMVLHVDEVIESKITALRDDGKRVKEEITNKMKMCTKVIAKQIEALEEKEVRSRNIQRSIHSYMNEASGIKLLKHYSAIKLDIENLLQETNLYSQPSVFEFFSTDTELGSPLQLELRETVTSAVEVCEDRPPLAEKKTVINHLKTHKAENQLYQAVRFIPAEIKHAKPGNKLMTGYTAVNSSKWNFIETIEGDKRTGRKPHESYTLQLLPYGSEILVLTSVRDTVRYTISGLDSGHIYYSYTDSYHSWYNKPMALISAGQLALLHRQTQTLHILSLVTEEKTFKSLADAGIIGARGITMASDGKLIISCESSEGHRLVKYDPDTLQVQWETKILSDKRLHVMGFDEFLYAIQGDRPTDVWRLKLSDGNLVQKIPCCGLPEWVRDVSMRGDTFVVAGGSEGISYFQINDVMYKSIFYI